MPTTASGRYVTRNPGVGVKASGAETANTSGAWLDYGNTSVAEFTVTVTAVTGTTPTLLVDIYGSPDGGTTVYKIITIGSNGWSLSAAADPTAISTVSTVRALSSCSRYIQYRSRIGGTTPSFTYAITSDAQ